MSKRTSRYDRQRARRAEQARADARATRAVTTVAGAATLFAFVIVVIAYLRGPAGFDALGPLAAPWIGGVSRLEALGLIFVGIIGLVFWRRLKK